MWMFTQIGFFSAVLVKDEHARELELPERNDPWVMVRARVRGDAVNLLALWYELHTHAQSGKGLLVSGEKSEIIEWPGRDYPYRIIMPRAHWQLCVDELARRIDYTNFKNQVKAVQGYSRAKLYGRVWGAMYDAEEKVHEMDESARRAAEFDPDDPGPGGAFDLSLFKGGPKISLTRRATTKRRKRGKKNKR